MTTRIIAFLEGDPYKPAFLYHYYSEGATPNVDFPPNCILVSDLPIGILVLLDIQIPPENVFKVFLEVTQMTSSQEVWLDVQGGYG